MTTPAAKPRLAATAKVVILAKRMSEALMDSETDDDTVWYYVPRGFTRRVGIALAGSSGQGCLG